MAFFLFVDESGFDRRESPYEVLAGLCVEDRDVWNLIGALKNAEERLLGVRYSREKEEIKGKKFLKRKVFRQAGQRPPFPDGARRDLARDCILNGASATADQIAALAQAKLAFVAEALDICGRFHCRAFASVVDANARAPLLMCFARTTRSSSNASSISWRTRAPPFRVPSSSTSWSGRRATFS